MSSNDKELPPPQLTPAPSLGWTYSDDKSPTDEDCSSPPAARSTLERTESAEKKAVELAIATGLGREQTPPPRLDRIADHVYLSNHDSATNRGLLEDHGITHILTVGIDMSQPFQLDVEYETIKEYDDENTDLFKHFNRAFEFIDAADQAGGKCLVHCRNGVSRSATIVVAYMMTSQCWDAGRALAHVRAIRPIILPNKTFLGQLKLFEDTKYDLDMDHPKVKEFQDRLVRSRDRAISKRSLNMSTFSPPTSDWEGEDDGGGGRGGGASPLPAGGGKCREKRGVARSNAGRSIATSSVSMGTISEGLVSEESIADGAAGSTAGENAGEGGVKSTSETGRRIVASLSNAGVVVGGNDPGSNGGSVSGVGDRGGASGGGDACGVMGGSDGRGKRPPLSRKGTSASSAAMGGGTGGNLSDTDDGTTDEEVQDATADAVWEAMDALGVKSPATSLNTSPQPPSTARLGEVDFMDSPAGNSDLGGSSPHGTSLYSVSRGGGTEGNDTGEGNDGDLNTRFGFVGGYGGGDDDEGTEAALRSARVKSPGVGGSRGRPRRNSRRGTMKMDSRRRANKGMASLKRQSTRRSSAVHDPIWEAVEALRRLLEHFNCSHATPPLPPDYPGGGASDDDGGDASGGRSAAMSRRLWLQVNSGLRFDRI